MDLTLAPPKMSTYRVFLRAIGQSTAIVAILVGFTAYAISEANLLDRFTNNLLSQSSAIFDYIDVYPLDVLIPMLLAGVVILAPFDYILGFNLQNVVMGNFHGSTTNYDYVIMMLLIYFVAGLFVGLRMRHTRNPFGGFILGFVAIAVLNLTVFIAIQFGSLIVGYYYPTFEGGVETVTGIINALLSGIYGESAAVFLLKGILLNGFILGVFGAFFTALMMAPAQDPMSTVIMCPDDMPICTVDQ